MKCCFVFPQMKKPYQHQEIVRPSSFCGRLPYKICSFYPSQSIILVFRATFLKFILPDKIRSNQRSINFKLLGKKIKMDLLVPFSGSLINVDNESHMLDFSQLPILPPNVRQGIPLLLRMGSIAEQAYFNNISQMGNSPQGLSGVQQLRGWGQLQQQSSEFIIREVTAHSAEQHRQLVVQLSRFKQYRCGQVVQLVDSHTLQANNLCSVIVHTYAVMLRPQHTLPHYLQHLHANNTPLCNKILTKMLSDIVKALVFLRQEGNEVDRITEEEIFIDEQANGEVAAKIMNPFFRESGYESEECRGAVADLGAILKKYLRFELHSQDLIQSISRMASGSISLEELEEKYAGKKGKVKLKVTKNASQQPYDRTCRAQRESLTSMVSDGSSLLIEAGDTSDFALKDFYQNLEGEISNIAEVHCLDPLLTSYTLEEEFNISHEFPKKYVKGRTFRKAQRTFGSEFSSEDKQNITRDQSQRGNLRIESRQILLHSAKLVHSFVQDPA